MRLYVKDLNPKLIPGPMGPPGTVGPVGPSGLPVRITCYKCSYHHFPLHRECWDLRAMKVHLAHEVSKGAKETLELLGLRV